MGLLSNSKDERGVIADRSLDRVKAAQVFSGAREVFQSRQELLANEYRKVIENHPGTLHSSDQYDDTDFLSRMFAKDKENILQSHALKHQESGDLVKSDSTQQLLQNNKRKRSESTEPNKFHPRLRSNEPKQPL